MPHTALTEPDNARLRKINGQRAVRPRAVRAQADERAEEAVITESRRTDCRGDKVLRVAEIDRDAVATGDAACSAIS